MKIKKDTNAYIEMIDQKIINFSKKINTPFLYLGIAVVYFWFGFLKILGVSPAQGLVIQLVENINPSLSAMSYVIGIGVFEIIIAFTILSKFTARLSVLFIFFHLILTTLPFFFLPEITWQAFLIPTLEGQYIIKNILIAAVSISIVSQLHILKHGK
jgi:uncharacterized membrane protein YkgB